MESITRVPRKLQKIENVIKEDIFLNILTVVSMILFIISLMIFAKYLQHYMEHTGCYYHLDYVLVKRHHRKDYKMTYEELEKNITKRKIIVRNVIQKFRKWIREEWIS